jgi:hypothetical protein
MWLLTWLWLSTWLCARGPASQHGTLGVMHKRPTLQFSHRRLNITLTQPPMFSNLLEQPFQIFFDYQLIPPFYL